MRRESRRFHGPLLNAIRRLDHQIRKARSGPRRILFDYGNDYGAVCAKPVIEVLLARGHRVFVTGRVHPRTFDPSLSPHWRAPAAADWSGWDAVIITGRPTVWYRRWTRSFYLYHGIGSGGGGKSYAVRMCENYDIDVILATGPQAAAFDELVIRNQVLPVSVIQVGFPKTDALVNGCYDRAATLRALGLDPTLPTVMVCSHWTPPGLLPTFGSRLIEALVTVGNCNLIVGGHPQIWQQECRTRLGSDWYSRLEGAVARTGIGRAFPEPDARPFLFGADLLVSDHSSISLEYAVLGRPIVFFEHPDWVWGDPRLLEDLRRATMPVGSIDEIVSAVAGFVSRPLPWTADTSELVACSHAVLGTAAESAADAILARLPADPTGT